MEINPKLYIRADASPRMGIGHIMRCLALACASQETGRPACIITCNPGNLLAKKIKELGVGLREIDHPVPNSSDITQTLKILNNSRQPGENMPWVVMDGYHFTPEYQAALKNNKYPVMVIDDYNHLSHYHADLLVNPNPGASRFAYNLSQGAKLLTGTDYVLLRKEFTSMPFFSRSPPQKAGRLLVTLGGSDPYGFTPLIIQAIAGLNDPDLDTRILVGPAAQTPDTLKALTGSHKIEFVQNPDMAAQMKWADLTITAGGSTCWELCFTGLPMIIIPVADNQTAVASGLKTRIKAVNAGPSGAITAPKITRLLETLIHDRDKRKEIGRLGQNLIDGKGGDRLIRQMLKTDPNHEDQ